MRINELLLLQRLIARWRMTQTLTHAQRNWLENMSIAISEKIQRQLEAPDDGIMF